MADATTTPSLCTSVCVVAAVWKFSPLGDLPLLTFAFFTMLPTLSALACLQDQRFLATFNQFFQWISHGADAVEQAQNGSMDALATARSELMRAFTDRWPAASKSSPFSISGFSSAELSTQLGNGMGDSIANNGGGKSLYDQVRSRLKDHVFSNASDAPIYFMDPSTGHFLRVNEQQKLVFTSAPDASCLFHVVKGKTHHWGFHSTIYQRYIGQNLIGKVVVNSKKMHSWESFRVLERPDASHHTSNANTEKTIYLVLCSARFGKGMWVGKQRRPPVNPTDTYLTKNFAHAVALVYASDLSAFEYLSHRHRAATTQARSNSDPAIVGPSKSSSWISMSGSESGDFGDEFQVPVLSSAERTRVMLPWIEDATSKRFFELPERQMVEVVSTMISRFTVRDMLEFFMDQHARRMCHEKTSQAPPPPPKSSSASSLPPLSTSGTSAIGALASMQSSTSQASMSEKRMSEWHLHPHFGYVRKLSYRPPAPSDDAKDMGDASLVPSISVDQYHSCSVDEKAMQKAVFRSKMYTLSIPHSNCFSVETVFEFQDIQDREVPYASTPTSSVLGFKCRTGIYFTRKSMFAPQIEKGVLEGVKKTCDLLLQLVDEFRLKKTNSSPALLVSQGPPTSDAGGRASPPSESVLTTRSPPDAFPPHTLAVEVIKGMIDVIRANGDDAGPTGSSRARSSLVIHMPWTPAEFTLAATPLTAATLSMLRARVGGFFESATRDFKLVLEEPIHGGYVVSPSFIFDVLLSDECSFFHVVHKQSGTMDVDIGAWRVARFPVLGDGQETPHVRKQLFRMPMTGIIGLDVAGIEDYQYYVIQREPKDAERLEFGMKIFARDLPDGDHFSIEVLVVVEHTATTECMLRVYSSIARSPRQASSPADDPLHAAVVLGTERGLKAVWKRVVQVVLDAARVHATADDARHRIQIDGHLPTHDELAFKVIDAIAALY